MNVNGFQVSMQTGFSTINCEVQLLRFLETHVITLTMIKVFS